jgi:hypothetical protein
MTSKGPKQESQNRLEIEQQAQNKEVFSVQYWH